MGLLDGIKGMISRETCSRAINYDKRNLEMNLSTEAAGVKFSLGDFKTEVEKIREASEFSEMLDNYQYQMCMACKSLKKDIRSQLKRRGIESHLKYCRAIFATYLRKQGIESEVIDIYQGRVPASIFAAHYLKTSIQDDRNRILQAVRNLYHAITSI
jgi:hypothetical protein